MEKTNEAIMEKVSFKHFVVGGVKPGENEYIKYRQQKRRRGAMGMVGGPRISESVELESQETEVDEALNMSQRLARKRLFKRIQPKIKIGRERAKRRVASKEKLETRSMKKAREALRKKITKDIPKSELSYARRQEIEKRLETPAMKKRIKTIARKLYPKVRQAEIQKKRGGAK
jgi:hypothetical protein